MIYDPQSHTDLVGLSHAAFASLAPPTRAALTRYQVSAGRRLVPTLKSVPATWRRRLKADGDGHRFVWWPDTLRQTGDEPLLRFVADDLLPSRHEQVSRQTWRRAASVLPGARELAGTFARSSGPNCFGTVMAAAGVANTADQWMLREPFEEWLCTHTRQGGADHLVGTVLVWRDVRGAAQHAAVVVGDGWAMHKPSQGWMTPVRVLQHGSADLVPPAADRRAGRSGRHRHRPADLLAGQPGVRCCRGPGGSARHPRHLALAGAAARGAATEINGKRGQPRIGSF